MDLFDQFSPQVLLLLTLLGALGGFINAIAGGAGLLVLPAMLWAGIPPVNALATGKCQALFGTLSSSIHYFRQLNLSLRPLLPLVAIVALASAIGTMAVTRVPQTFLASALPFLLVGLSVYTLFAPNLDDEDRPSSVSTPVFNSIFGPLIGLYGGFFGPCMGSLSTLAFARARGCNLRRALAYSKPVVMAINLASVAVFALAGEVWWTLALLMGTAQLIGARLGAALALRKGAAIIRPAIVITALLVSLKLLWDMVSG